MAFTPEQPVEHITLACRHCGAKNRIPTARAVEDLGKPRCGRCNGQLFRVNGEPLLGLDPELLTHPFDKAALDALKKVPALDTVISKVMGGTFDKFMHFQFMAGAVRVSERQAPRLWNLYLEAAGRLDVDPPPLFIYQSPVMNAHTRGSGTPIVGVTTALLEHMGDREVLGVLGHELTHVKLGHVLYRTLAWLLISGGLRVLNMFGLAKLVIYPLQLALARWSQMAELSADRGEMLATGSVRTGVRTHMMLAGGTSGYTGDLDEEEFIEQADEAEAMRDEDLVIWALEMMQSSNLSHPLPVWRVHHMLKWSRTETFLRTLAGEHVPVIDVK